MAYSYNTGSVFTDPSVPVEDFRAQFHTQALSYYRSFDFAGRSANITALVPYALGNFSAKVAGTQTDVYRSGIADSRVRLAVNLWGGPAMNPNTLFSRATEWLSTRYHMPTDVIESDWNWEGARNLGSFALVTGLRIANQENMPAWKPGSPYRRPAAQRN